MNWTDYFIIGVLALSCVAGLMRGLLKELVSALTWLLATWVAWNFADLLEPHLGGALALAGVRTWAARTILFVLVLLAGMSLGAILGLFVRLSLVSSVDRLFGFLFGALRGVVALGLLAILCHAVRLDGERWYHQSTLAPYVDHAGNGLRMLVGERKIFSSRPSD